MNTQLRTTATEGTSALQTLEPMGIPAMSRVDMMYSPEYFGGLAQLAGAAAKSRLFGELSQDQLFMVLMTGREMNLPPTVALRNIGSFKGKTVISSQLQMAMVRSAGYDVLILENTEDKATVSVGRPGKTPYVKTFTMADAVKAGLLNNALYKTNPATMLLNRAIGLACRYGAPEVLNGLHNEAELLELEDGGAGHASGAVRDAEIIPFRADLPAAPAGAWRLDHQETFAALEDRLYIAFKTAGKLDRHAAESAKWKARKSAGEAADVVLADLENLVSQLETAAKAAPAAATTTQEPAATTAGSATTESSAAPAEPAAPVTFELTETRIKWFASRAKAASFVPEKAQALLELLEAQPGAKRKSAFELLSGAKDQATALQIFQELELELTPRTTGMPEGEGTLGLEGVD